MAFFDDLISGVGDFASNNAGSLLKAGATIGGALITNSANSDAAKTASDAYTTGAQVQSDAATRAAQITADANQKALEQYLQFSQQGRDQLNQAKAAGLAAIDNGTNDYTTTISPLLTSNPILLPTYRGLTDQQQTGEADLLRNGQATLAASGLRGAGRAGIGAIMDSDRRYQEDARASNDTDTRTEMRRAQGVANNARSNLASIQASAGGAKANTEIGVGNQLAANLNSTGSLASSLTQSTGAAGANAATVGGQATANAIDQSGTTNANSALASAKTDASTLGTLGSILNGGTGIVGQNSGTSAFDGGGRNITDDDTRV